MRFELHFKIFGQLEIIKNSIEIKSNPYTIKLFKDKNQFYISISKKIDANSDCLPKLSFGNKVTEVIMPKESAYNEMIEYINHIESFGAIDNKIEYIDKINLQLKWIPESDTDHFSPIENMARTLETKPKLDIISQDWLIQTVVHKRQLAELFIPFSFFRDAKIMFYSAKYQTAFCTFYMMLEYFFHDQKRGWGINNNAFKNDACLRASLTKTLNQNLLYPDHFKWLNEELVCKKKDYNEEGLLTVLNIYRNDFSHASDKNKNRNIFNENKYFSLAFVTLMVCNFVIIKKRLAPFVSPSDLDEFFER